MQQAKLFNLGPKSQTMLAQVGIFTLADLQAMGAVAAYARVKQYHNGATLNLLWALEGALTARPWQDVAKQDRLSLLLQLEDYQKTLKANHIQH